MKIGVFELTNADYVGNTKEYPLLYKTRKCLGLTRIGVRLPKGAKGLFVHVDGVHQVVNVNYQVVGRELWFTNETMPKIARFRITGELHDTFEDRVRART